MSDYKIVEAEGYDILEDAVKELMSEGWEPLGGITSPAKTASRSRHRRVAQALVRTEEAELEAQEEPDKEPETSDDEDPSEEQSEDSEGGSEPEEEPENEPDNSDEAETTEDGYVKSS